MEICVIPDYEPFESCLEAIRAGSSKAKRLKLVALRKKREKLRQDVCQSNCFDDKTCI